jgi:hypothetical protein
MALVLTLSVYLLINLESSLSGFSCLALTPFVSTDPGKLFRHVLRFTSWSSIQRFKKHKALAHCRDVPNNINSFRKPWIGVSGVYKITFLPFRLFSYYGSSTDLGNRLKYHYYSGPKQENFLGLFLKVFGWSCFSITIVETCSRDQVTVRENWYLLTFQPLLNVLMSASIDPRVPFAQSLLTRSKISATLTGRKDSDETRSRKSIAQLGAKNPIPAGSDRVKKL